MDINHPSCPPSYKLSNYLRKTIILQCTICINKRLKLNYVLIIMKHLIILLNGVDDIFKTSKTYNEKIIILIIFQNSKIETLTREKINHYYNNNIESK